MMYYDRISETKGMVSVAWPCLAKAKQNNGNSKKLSFGFIDITK